MNLPTPSLAPGRPIQEQLWIELVDGIVVIKLRGLVSAALIQRCQPGALEWRGSAESPPVLYDALELHAPPWAFELPELRHSPSIAMIPTRAAIVLADARLRNPLRRAFSEAFAECRIFEGDLEAAYSWVRGGRGRTPT
jgi:hypothetical protein